ncbi:hypothetical protein NIES4071_32020 [Calothrix sp. NIES-4071]|nr:hypothetical protein NIES4071_32020 [Calothrix sp. NIES-4071]BAZ57522.1 hypothetical protein NIES4105_31960 [Calothrix sp. NIES-4105]
MKITARNPEILKSVKLENLRNYLLDSGWYEDRPFLENATVWLKQEPNNGEFEILLPSQQDVGDYAIRVGEAVKTLAEVENRTPIGILGELLTTFPTLQIQGLVSQIQAPINQNIGKVTLFGVVFDKLRKINVFLANDYYIIAMKAYQERLPVLCVGDLTRGNDVLMLNNLQRFELDNI